MFNCVELYRINVSESKSEWVNSFLKTPAHTLCFPTYIDMPLDASDENQITYKSLDYSNICCVVSSFPDAHFTNITHRMDK